MNQLNIQQLAENAACYVLSKQEMLKAAADHEWSKVERLSTVLEDYKNYLESDGVDVKRL